MIQSTLGIGVLCGNKALGDELVKYLSHYYPATKQQLPLQSSSPSPQPTEQPQPHQPPPAPSPYSSLPRLTISTKYYTATPSIHVVSWDQLSNLPFKDIECLLVLTSYDEASQHLTDQLMIKDSLEPTISKYNPTSQAIIVNCKEDTEVPIEDVVGNMDTFVEVVYEDFGRLRELEELPKLPKSLMEDANGITRVVLLLESTTWKQMTFKEKKQPVINKPAPVKTEQPKSQQEQCMKIQKQMDEFANIMTEMCNIRNTPMADDERRRRAEEVIMKLMQGLDEDDGEGL